MGERVIFTLAGLENRTAHEFLAPAGTMVVQFLGFPVFFADCTCVPIGPTGIWSQTQTSRLEAQWYQRREPLTRSDIPGLDGAPRVKAHICHRSQGTSRAYPLTTLKVGGKLVQGIFMDGKKIRFRRLGHEVELDLSDAADDQRFTLAAEWSVSHIELRATWVECESDPDGYSGTGILYEDLDNIPPIPPDGRVRFYTTRTDFSVSFIPAQVARAIWKHAPDVTKDPPEEERLAPGALRNTYESTDDFLDTVCSVIDEIRTALEGTSPEGYWNKLPNRDRAPKTEPESGSTLLAFFLAICAYKNIRVVAEPPTRSGCVDFLFGGITKSSKHITTILELKNAHSQDLERGLTKQLPTYMREHGCDAGFYLVLWFKGRFFDRPQSGTLAKCLERLTAIRPTGVRPALGLDLSFRERASKLR